jgi:hypothetical protein
MRDAINKYKTNNDPDYCVRVTSDEWVIWRTYLERFQDNDKTIPTILTSSQMLTTWVDARNIRQKLTTREERYFELWYYTNNMKMNQTFWLKRFFYNTGFHMSNQ